MTFGEQMRLDRISALLILALVLALFWLGPVSAYLRLVAAGGERLDQAQQTLLRYRALARVPDHHSAPARTEAALLFPAIPDSQAAALLQETVKSAAAAAQVEIKGLQVLRTDVHLPGAVRIGVQVRASGDIGSLGRLLYAIEAARPILYADNLHIQSRPPQPVGRPGQATALLDFQLDVSGFKPGPST
jgi:general secretion pathway protein M